MHRISKLIALVTLVIMLSTLFGNVLTAEQTISERPLNNQVADNKITDQAVTDYQPINNQASNYEYYYDKLNITKQRIY